MLSCKFSLEFRSHKKLLCNKCVEWTPVIHCFDNYIPNIKPACELFSSKSIRISYLRRRPHSSLQSSATSTWHLYQLLNWNKHRGHSLLVAKSCVTWYSLKLHSSYYGQFFREMKRNCNHANIFSSYSDMWYRTVLFNSDILMMDCSKLV